MIKNIQLAMTKSKIEHIIQWFGFNVFINISNNKITIIKVIVT